MRRTNTNQAAGAWTAGAVSALALVVALTGAVPAHGQALISNNPVPPNSGSYANPVVTPTMGPAFGFRTGASVTNAAGEVLEFESLTIVGSVLSASPGALTGGVYRDKGGSPSGLPLTTFDVITAPMFPTVLTLRPTSTLALAPDTIYWVAVTNPVAGTTSAWYGRPDYGTTVTGPSAAAVTPLGFQYRTEGRWVSVTDNYLFAVSLSSPSLFLDGPTRTTITDAARKSYRNIRVGQTTATNLTLAEGADVNNVFLNRTSRLFMNGGHAASVTAGDDSVVYINEGTVDRLSVTGSGTAYVLAGSFADLSVSKNGNVHVYGGTISPHTLLAYGDGQMYLNGDDLRLDFASATPGDDGDGVKGIFYDVTGTLTDGTPLNTRLFDAAGGRTFVNGTGSVLFFNGVPVYNASAAAPEPGSLALFALVGGCAAGAPRTRRGRSNMVQTEDFFHA